MKSEVLNFTDYIVTLWGHKASAFFVVINDVFNDSYEELM